MANTNVLAGIQCPKCKQEEHFFIVGAAEFSVTDDGSSEFTKLDWCDEDFIRCGECGAVGRVGEFTLLQQEEKLFELIGFVRKRYTTLVAAKNGDTALAKVDLSEEDIEHSWLEDLKYQDEEVVGARELEGKELEELKESHARVQQQIRDQHEGNS